MFSRDRWCQRQIQRFERQLAELSVSKSLRRTTCNLGKVPNPARPLFKHKTSRLQALNLYAGDKPNVELSAM